MFVDNYKFKLALNIHFFEQVIEKVIPISETTVIKKY